MYTTADLYDYASLYYLQACIGYGYEHRPDRKARYALRCLLYTISANMIYEGRF
jgi:hypothetical protein